MPAPVHSDVARTGAAGHCPRCGVASVNVQGIADCPECSWSEFAIGR